MASNESLPVLQSFPPVADAEARILILGSMPGARSLQQQQYYAHRQNAFWRIMGELVQAEQTMAYADRLAALRKSHIALWDVLKHCQRSGSLDAAIQTDSIVTNDFAGLFDRCPQIECVAFNGQKAEQLFLRYVLPELRMPDSMALIRLPSTSPAHAAMSFDRKLRAWRQAIHTVCS